MEFLDEWRTTRCKQKPSTHVALLCYQISHSGFKIINQLGLLPVTRVLRPSSPACPGNSIKIILEQFPSTTTAGTLLCSDERQFNWKWKINTTHKSRPSRISVDLVLSYRRWRDGMSFGEETDMQAGRPPTAAATATKFKESCCERLPIFQSLNNYFHKRPPLIKREFIYLFKSRQQKSLGLALVRRRSGEI